MKMGFGDQLMQAREIKPLRNRVVQICVKER